MNMILSWCAHMFKQNDGVIRVRTASCQNGALSAVRHTEGPVEIISNRSYKAPVKLEENIIFLNRKEASFINKEVRILLKTQMAEASRKKRAGIPPPPTPGKIAYAVYQ